MNAKDIGYIILGVVIGLGIAYYFLWGEKYTELNLRYDELSQNYTKLNQDYNKLKQDYDQLNQKYTTLQLDYNKLRDESGQALGELKACKGRETFFTWVARFQSLAGLAKYIGLI